MKEQSKSMGAVAVMLAVVIAAGAAVCIVVFSRIDPWKAQAETNQPTGMSQGETRTAEAKPSSGQALDATPSPPISRARQMCMLSSLQTLRSQIELYKAQHNDAPPGLQANGGIDADDFVRDLTSKTDAKGLTVGPDGYGFGPYLAPMASNPFMKGPAAERVKVGPSPCPCDGTAGWYFETDTLNLYANHLGATEEMPPQPVVSRRASLRHRARTSTEAREAVLESDLQIVRVQIELYKLQHNDTPPGRQADGRVDGADLKRDLVTKTDPAGRQAPDGRLGPYLQRMPVNPFVDGATADAVKVGESPCPGDGTSGWYFETDTGRFCANHALLTGRQVR